MGSLIVILGLVAVILFLWYVRDNVRNAGRNELLDKFGKFPVRSFPLVGHLWYFLGSSKNCFTILDETWARSVEPFVFWLGMVPIVNVAKLEDIEEISKMSLTRYVHGILDAIVEDGIVTQSHEKWKKTRRLITPAFGQVMLTQYLQTFNEQSEVLVDLLRQKAIEGEIFNLWPFFINAHIDIITENMIGVQSDCQRSHGNEFSKAFLRMISTTFNRIVNPLLYPDFVYKIYLYLTGLSRDVEKLYEYPRKKINEVLRNKNDPIQNVRRTSLSSTDNDVPKYLIDLLLAEHIRDPGSMTEKQISSEMISMIAAGSETTAVSSCLTLLMYGVHQAEQEAVYQEIKRIIPEDRPVTMEDLNQLDYMDKTIKETLRFFSVAPMTERRTEYPTTLSSSGKTIPSDVHVLIQLRSMHDNPLYYPNPRKWNPENFNTEAVESRPKNSFAPFGIGLRSCIGSKYAMLSEKILICHFLRKYHISTDTKIDQMVLDQDIVRRSRDGYHVKLSFRDT